MFIHRESDDPNSFCASRATGLVEMVTNAIHEKCRIVNQVRFRPVLSRSIVVIERFLIECRKTKTKIITLANRNRCEQQSEQPIRI